MPEKHNLLPGMDFRKLRYFQAVAEELNFSRAAHRLHVAQPALSRAVQDLEESLGVQLLNRTRRSVSITPAGAALLHETGILMQRRDEVMRRIQRVAAGEEGELRVGYIGPPTQLFLGRIVKEFRNRFPRVSVTLEERTPERVWEMVARGRLEIGLTRPVLARGTLGLQTRLLRKETLSSVFPVGHRLAKSDAVRWRALKDDPLIILARREGVGLHDEILAACYRARFTPKLSHTPSLISTVLTYVESGAGIGIMADSVASLATDRPLVFRPLTPKQGIDLVMVWSDAGDSPVSASFRGLIDEWQTAGLLWEGRA